MDPEFKNFGYKFLQQNWRDKAGVSWISGKPIEPGDSSEPGDQRRDGQHEWFPTAKIPKILHTVLRHYSKQDQLAWISALDMFRTPTSDVAINFTWKKSVKRVNDNPNNFEASQVGIWQHHSGGLYTAEKQVNKGNGSFHNKINQLIDRYLKPDKSQLIELLDALKHFIKAELWEGKLPDNLGLSKNAMKKQESAAI